MAAASPDLALLYGIARSAVNFGLCDLDLHFQAYRARRRGKDKPRIKFSLRSRSRILSDVVRTERSEDNGRGVRIPSEGVPMSLHSAESVSERERATASTSKCAAERGASNARVHAIVALLLATPCSLVSAQTRSPSPQPVSDEFRSAPVRTPIASSTHVGGHGFQSSNVNFLSNVTLADFPAPVPDSANDVWGYVSPSGREYAILGLNNSTGFVEVTDPINPVIVGKIPDAVSIWSDMRSYGEYAYNCNESGGGLQTFNLTQIDSGVVTLVGSLTQNGLQTSHTLAVNAESGFLYLCGSNLGPGGFGGDLVPLSLANPAAPAFVPASAASRSYVHAALVVNYHTGTWAGKEIAFCFCGRNGLRIVDVTTKTNMTILGSLQYPNQRYTHQGWLSEDRKYLFIDDELDERELPHVNTTTTYVIDVQQLDNPTFFSSFTNGMPAVDHNLMVRGNHLYEANYTSGLRIWNIQDVSCPREVGWFDTYTPDDTQQFEGAWGVYSLLPSGTILVSDISFGLFALDPTPAISQACLAPAALTAESAPIAKNRYLSFRTAGTCDEVALKVTLVDLPAPFEAFNGEERWVGEPEVIFGPSAPPGGFNVASLQCTPHFRRWSSFGSVHLSGDAIIPGGGYEIRAVGLPCGGPNGPVSAPLSVLTAGKFGDVSGATHSSPPNNIVNFQDVAAIVASFNGSASAPTIPRADLYPGVPDRIVNFLDISADVGAFQGKPYPFAGPSGCP